MSKRRQGRPRGSKNKPTGRRLPGPEQCSRCGGGDLVREPTPPSDRVIPDPPGRPLRIARWHYVRCAACGRVQPRRTLIQR